MRGYSSSSPAEVTEVVANSTPTAAPVASFRSLAQALCESPASTTRFLSRRRAEASNASRAAG